MTVDISRELAVIFDEPDGELVAANIAMAAQILQEQEYTGANIDDLLQIIRTGTYGRDIRWAIYEALRLLSEESGGGGPENGLAYLYGDMYCKFDGTVMDFAAENIVYGTMIPMDYPPSHGFTAIVDRTSGSTKSSQVIANHLGMSQHETSLILVLRRSDVSISDENYSLIAESNQMATSDSNQWVDIYRRDFATEPVESVTFSQSSSSYRLGVNNVVLDGTNISLTLVGNELISSFPYTPTAKNGKRRLYVASSINGNNSDVSVMSITASTQTLQMEGTGFNRLFAWFDWQPNVNETPVFNYWSPSDYSSGSATMLVFDVEGNF